MGQGRVAYIPWGIDRTFWQVLNVDHGRLFRNIVCRAPAEGPVVAVEGPGMVDVTAWRQERSMTVRLVNLTNPMMHLGPFPSSIRSARRRWMSSFRRARA